jgi:hypothetical protein
MTDTSATEKGTTSKGTPQVAPAAPPAVVGPAFSVDPPAFAMEAMYNTPGYPASWTTRKAPETPS